MSRARVVPHRGPRRLAAAVLVALALAAGWTGWLVRRPRPPLASFVPANADLVVELRGAGQFFARLHDLDRDGALLGPAGAVTTGLRRLVGPAGREDVLGEIGRDEALAAVLPRGRWLVVFRPGAREAVADRVVAALGLVGTQRTGRGRIRTVRLPDGSRVAWALRPGVAFLASDDVLLRAALVGGAPVDRPPAGPVHLSARWQGPGRLDSVTFSLRATEAGLTGRMVLSPDPAALAAGPPPPPRPLRIAGRPAALAIVELPEPDLLAWCWPGGARRLRAALATAARETGVPETRLRDVRPVIVWLGVDRRGIVPMPQLWAELPGVADLVDARLVARLDARLRAGSHDRLRLEPAGAGWAVNFPVTRTFAPALGAAGDAAIVATSVAALETAVAGRVAPSGRGLDGALLRRPAHAALVLDLGALAAESRLTIAGLREYGLLAPVADRRWTEIGTGWAAAAEAIGRLTVTACLEDGRLVLDFETTPPPRADFLVAARGD